MKKDFNKKKSNREYSKLLLTQESALIWIETLGMLVLAYICIIYGYIGSLPWLAAMVAFPWTAYGVSQGFYYTKSKKENTKDGIKYESVMAEINAKYKEAQNNSCYIVDDIINEYGNTISTNTTPVGQEYWETIDLDAGI